MIDLGTLALVLCGLVLLFAGAALSVYGVVLLGTIVGAGGGYLLGPTAGAVVSLEGTLAVAGTTLVGAAAGGVLGYLLLTVTVAALSFVVGTFFGFVVLSPTVVSGAWYVEAAFALAVGAGAALLATLLTKTMLIVITAVVGASLASTSLTLAEFQAAQEATSLEPLLFDVTPLFLALIVFGILSQFGLFKLGYVTRLMRVLPGAKMIPNRSDTTETESA